MMETTVMASALGLWTFLAAGTALPLGVVPEEVDPVMMQAAPAECVAFTTWAGLDTIDPQSENRFEALLGEPEVKQFYTTLIKVAKDAINRQAAYDGSGEAQAMVKRLTPIVEMLLSEPSVLFVEELQIDPRMGPSGKVGAVFALGDKTVDVKFLIETFFPMIPEEMRRTIEHEGRTYHYIRLGPPGQNLMFTFEGDYLVAGIGDGVVTGILKRITATQPTIAPWLAATREKLFPERFSSMLYINVEKIRELLMPMAPPQVASLLEATGIDSITELTTVNGLDGPDVVSRTYVGVDGPLRGLLGLVDAPTLTFDDLSPVPADSTYAVVKQVDPAETFKVMMQVLGRLGPEASVVIAQVFGYAENVLGVNLMTDLLEPLGNKWYVYSSPGEGGLGLIPTIVVSVDDYDKLAVTEQKLIEAARKSIDMIQKQIAEENDRIQQEMEDDGAYYHARAEGPTVQIKQAEFEGETIYYIDFAVRYGDPIPIAPSWCLTKKGLIIGYMPQFIKAHLRREADAKSLGDVPEVAARLAAKDSNATSLGYLDLNSLLDAVYPLTVYGWQMVSSAAELEGEVRLSPALLPSIASIRPHMGPMVATYGPIEGGLLMDTRGPIPPQTMSVGLAVPVALLMPAVASARDSARRAASMNNMKQIMMALMMYEMDHGRLPPAYTVDDDGKPLLSWRVAILPYIESQNLYERFKQDEPWDSPHNKQLMQIMPQIYMSPRSELDPTSGMTTYQTPSGKGIGLPTAGKKLSMNAIRDGLSNTIAIVETAPYKAVSGISE